MTFSPRWSVHFYPAAESFASSEQSADTMADVSEPPVHRFRDEVELRQWVEEQTLDLRTLDLAGFRRWLDLQTVRWQTDPAFVQRVRIRSLRMANPQTCEHWREIGVRPGRRMQRHRRQPVAALERKLHATEKAIAGLTDALASACRKEARLEARATTTRPAARL